MTFLARLLRSELARSSTVYTASTILNAGIPFLLMPVMTRYLTPGDYGLLSMFFVLLGFVTPFVGLSMHGAVSVKYFDRDGTDLPAYVGNCFIVLIVSSTLTGGLLWFASPLIARRLMLPIHWMWAIPAMAVAQFIIQLLMTLWQADGKPIRYGLFQNLQSLLNIALALTFVVFLGMDWRGRLVAHMITLGGFSLLGLVLLRRQGWLKLAGNLKYVMHALSFGAPLIPHAICGMIISQTDRVFIANMVSVADTGVYSVGYQIASILEISASSFNLAYVPWLYKRLASPDAQGKERIVRYTYVYFVMAIAAAAILSIAARWLLGFFVGPQFSEAYRYTTWLAFGFCFNGMYYMVANYIFYASKTYLLSVVTVVTSAINIVLNYVLIKSNGAIGAAQATAAAYCVGFLLTWALSSHVYEMPWKPSWLKAGTSPT